MTTFSPVQIQVTRHAIWMDVYVRGSRTWIYEGMHESYDADVRVGDGKG